ncbi:MAG: hypothetical protein AB8B91_09085 [Rubripirellula sp.]
MPVFDECCVLIPAATLEDFPSDLSDSDARSLLAAWTVLWHPGLLAQTEQTPIWYRADSPPDPVGKRLITVPAPSKPELPSGYEARAQVSEGCLWVTGASRKEMLETIDGALDSAPIGTLTANGRQIGIEDFFAAGFAALQVQVMTRRLRYTSNLDEIHLQNRIVAAAKAFLAGSAEEAIAALHDVFDCLAEERDHYFSSDPHLIDLTLTSESTMESLIRSIDSKLSQSGDEESIATPMNVLIDWDVAQAIGRSGTEAQSLKSAIADNQIGWAGGGPSSDACLDTMSLSEAEALFVDAHRTTTEAVGSAPEVFARFSGSTPADMTPTLTKLGYCGMIPLDFAAGTGHGDEAKVIMQSAGAEMEALTAKPMDAASDASFLTLGPQLGEAIDSGEIATALMAHWPEQGCDSFHDLLKVSSWSLCLGRFWKLNDYFKDGEHPYHHGSATISSASSAQLLTTLVAQNASDPIATLAENFRSSVTAEHQRLTSAMTRLVSRDPNRDSADPASDFAAAVTGSTSDAKQSPDASKILINPHAIGARTSVTLATAPKDVKHVFASSSSGNGNETTVDIPAYGFVILKPSGRTGDPRVSFSQRVKDKFLGAPQSMAESGRLHNEFMDVTISDESGGISGVYSGSLRGNRFSLRLVSNGHVASDKTKKTDKTKKKDQSGKSDNPDASESKMVCQKVTVVESTAALG